MTNSNIPIDLVSIFISALSAIITWYIGQKTLFTPLKIDVAKQQLYKVYLPLFTTVEPYLYKMPSRLVIDEFIKQFSKIKSENYELIPSDLILLFDDLSHIKTKNKFTEETYDSFCHHIEKNFEKLRKRLSLPTRGFFYKHRYGQFHSELRSFIDWFIDASLKLILMISIFFLVSLLLQSVVGILSKFLSLFK